MFVDTNILVQARFSSGPMHAEARQLLGTIAAGPERSAISRQVIREYLAVVTRPQTWAVPLPMAEALGDIERLARSFTILEDGPDVTRALIELCRTVPIGGRQIHDANIVATMLAHGECRLLTFNTVDFIRFTPGIELIRP